jgi:archaellum component FlaC
MEAMREAWTDERLDYLNHRVDDGFKKVDERFQQVDTRFDRVDAELGRVNDRIDGCVAVCTRWAAESSWLW